MSDINSEIAHLHAVWNAATGQALRMGICDYEREFGYHQFIKAGFTAQDISTVVNYLHREIAKGNRLNGALRWSNCIGNLVRFDEDLQMAKAAARIPKPSARDKVLSIARPIAVQVPVEKARDTSKHVSHYIAALKAAAGMHP